MKLFRITTIPLSLRYLLRGQLKYFKNQGYEVVAISSGGPEIEGIEREEEVSHIGIPMTRSITPFSDLRSLWLLYRLLRKTKPDIVHTHTPKAGLLGIWAAKLARVPVRMHTVAGLPLMEAEGLKKAIMLIAEKMTYNMATMVYPNSTNLHDYIIKNFYKDVNKLKVLANGSSNGIDVSHFQPNESLRLEGQKIRAFLEIDSNKKVAIFIGRIVTDKGINELVRAFENLSDTHLILVGPKEHDLDPLERDVLELIKSNDRIHQVGFQTDIRPYLMAADFLVFPSYREGFPNVPLQAGAMGLASIVTDINGCNEIVKDNENGIIIPPKDQEALEKAIIELSNDAELLHRLSANARKKIIDNYDRELIWEALEAEYQRLIKECT